MKIDFSVLFGYIAIITVLGILYYQWIFGYWKRRNVATLPPNFLFGNLNDLVFGRIAVPDLFRKAYREFKPKGYKYVGFYSFLNPMLLVLDPKVLEQICIKDFSHFIDHTLYINKEVDPLSANLLNMKGSDWKHMRRILTPAFSGNKLKIILEQVLRIGNNLKINLNDSCENSKAVDVKGLCSKYLIDVFGTSFLGIDCNLLLNQSNEFAEVVDASVRGNLWQKIKTIISVYYPTILSGLGFPVTDKRIEEFFISITKQTVDYREKNNVKINDFMQLLIRLRNNMDFENNDNMDLSEIGPGKGKTLSIHEIAAEVYLFLVAGSDTSSSTITMCLFELVQNPKLYQKVKDEIEKVLAKQNGEINYNALMDMSYLDTCIKETLRKYPPIPTLNRECTKDWNLPGTDLVIKKGQTILVPTLELHYDAEYFPNPDLFDPDRFSTENRPKIPSGAYLPFGDGPRICIGMRLASILIKVALTILLQNYKFTLNSKTTLPLEKDKGSFSGIKGGIWMNVEKINK